MADVFGASAGQQAVEFSLLVKRAAEAAFVNLKELCEVCPEQSDAERKINLLKFIVRTRQRLLRLLVLAKWCRQIPLVDRCQQLAGTISNHDVSFTQASDSLFFLHESLQQARAPSYDVPTAVEVLLTGSYHRLPKCIEDLGMKAMLEGEERELSLQKLDTLLRARLLNVALPKEFSAVNVSEGRVFLTVKGEFEVHLTLGYRGALSLWRILHLELLVGESSGSAKLTDMQRLALGDDLERRMAASDDPFGLLYSILHEFCVALVMDTLFRQVQTLRQGRWKDAIRFDVISDLSTAGHALSAGQGIGQGPGPSADEDTDLGTSSKTRSSPGLKITYWLDPPKGAGVDASSLPSLVIEQGPDQQLCCSHRPPLIDPATANEAHFLVDQSCLDVERLILKAISCNIHSRLLEVKRTLKNSTQLFRVDSDIILRASGGTTRGAPSSKDSKSSNIVTLKDHWVARDANNLGEETLCVRAYGMFYVALGINIRNGRYLLSVPHTLSLDGVISEMEEALNQGTITPLEMFICLRNKSLLQLFSTIGASLNLKAFEKGATSVKIPRESTKLNSDVLIMSFPYCENLYFLSIQLDAAALPIFYLLDAQSERVSAKSVQAQTIHIFRQLKIDLETITVTEDDARVYTTHGSAFLGTKNLLQSLSLQNGHSLKQAIQSSDKNRNLPSLSKPENTTVEGVQPDEASQRKLQELDGSKSPFITGDSAASPLNLDDDDLSKLIDSISSKEASVQRNTLMGGGTGSWLPTDALNSQLPRPSKRRKIHLDDCKSPATQAIAGGMEHDSVTSLERFVGMSYSNVVAAANQGQVPLATYTTIFLQVVKRCWLCIKHARLTSQMDALGVPYVEEVGLGNASTNLCFRFPSTSFKGDIMENCTNRWQHMRLSLGRPGSTGWEVKVQDAYYVTLWKLQNQKMVTDWGSEVLFATLSEADSHIHCTQDGLVLSYESVQDNSVKKMLEDLERLRNARAFALGMKKLLENRSDEKFDRSQELSCLPENKKKFNQEKLEGIEFKGEVIRRAFRVEAVGLTSLWFSYSGSMPGVQARFVVEWCVYQRGCVVHISPEQLWPHTKYLEEYINGGEVELLLDAIRITAGPLHALAGAIRPARMMSPVPTTPGVVGTLVWSKPGPTNAIVSPSSTNSIGLSRGMVTGMNSGLLGSTGGTLGPVQSAQAGAITSGPGRGSGPGLVPSSLLPTDISVLLRSAYWIRIVYRKDFAVDMRCFTGDQVWLQPAPPPYSGGPEAGGSLPCPQFRPFVMENVALGLNNPESIVGGPAPGSLGQGLGVVQTNTAGSFSGSASTSKRGIHPSVGATRPGATVGVQGGGMTPRSNIMGNALGPQGFSAPGNGLVSGRGISVSTGAGVYPGYRGELNTALFGLGDDGGYGGAWVPLAALKKVLRGTLRYLGVLWLFAQFPSIIREILGSMLNVREGTLLHLDAEQPALRFHVGNCMFAVSMHRHQLYLQAVNVKKFHPQQQQQQQAQNSGAETELSTVEMSEIGDFFARRVTSEPYDASRLASFVTMLTLPVPVLREFLGLISWKKDTQKAAQTGEPLPRPRVELCLENRMALEVGSTLQEPPGVQNAGVVNTSVKSSIYHDREKSIVEFSLTLYFDPANVPHINAAGGAGWLPQCVAIKLRCNFAEGFKVTLLNMEGSHGGRACWSRQEDWDRCKERVERAIEISGGSASQKPGQGVLRSVAESLQITLQSALQLLRSGPPQ